MLVGHLDFDNVLALVGGVITILVGAALVRWPGEIGRAMEAYQRRLGNSPGNTSERHARWVGIGFMAGGVILAVLSLFVNLTS